MKWHYHADKGFTLIEILIVVMIIGVLIAIIIPNYLSYVTKGYNSAALADLRNFKDAMEAYYADYRMYPTY
jgi:type IV pilus assembly protein PilA